MTKIKRFIQIFQDKDKKIVLVELVNGKFGVGCKTKRNNHERQAEVGSERLGRLWFSELMEEGNDIPEWVAHSQDVTGVKYPHTHTKEEIEEFKRVHG